MPIKPLSFKGEKRVKKRKHRDDDEKTALVTNEGQSEESDFWTSPDSQGDVSGPTLIVLPTTPPTCLAADAHGNIFASPLENMIEDDPTTAEPHDVRQVWITSRVAGTDTVSFKASHGGFLSCDNLGVLGARREARGVEEGFSIEMSEPDERSGRTRWQVRTAASKATGDEGSKRYLCALVEGSGGEGEGATKKVNISLRGDGTSESKTVGLILRMQAKFKPRLQHNKEQKAKEKISRQELETVVGRKLDDDEVKRLKRARKDGTYHEEILDVRVKGKHDKFA